MTAVMTRERFSRMVGTVDYDESTVFDAPIENLLTRSNQKTLKGDKYGYSTLILHLAPARASGFQVCSSASAGCRAACLNTAGRGGIIKRGETDNTIQRARRRRTHWFMARRDEFMRQLDHEIDLHAVRSASEGKVATVRPNGTSDIKWEHVVDDNGATLFDRHPDVVFYDYTKHPGRDVSRFANYSLTFSLSEANLPAALAELERGVNVAAVFKSQPETFLGYPVVSGDDSDLRFLDPSPCIVGLTAKGKAKRDTSGFVIHDHTAIGERVTPIRALQVGRRKDKHETISRGRKAS